MIFINGLTSLTSSSILLCLTICYAFGTEVMNRTTCFYPDKSFNNESTADRGKYLVGSVIKFFCKENYSLIGEETIQCLRNNTWSSSTPLCGFNVALRKSIFHEKWKHEAKDINTSRVNDGNITSCHKFTLNKKLRFLTLLHQRNISFIDIYLQNLTDVNITVQLGRSSSEEKCDLEKIVKTIGNIKRLKFNCLGAVTSTGRHEIQVAFTSTNLTDLTLCEIAAISHSERTCGTPEESLGCKSSKTENSVEYTPMSTTVNSSNHKSATNWIRYCKQGKWSGKSPVCEDYSEKINSCGRPETPANGKLSPIKHGYRIGERVKIICQDGFLLDGPDIYECQNGSWDSHQRFCDKNSLHNSLFEMESYIEETIISVESLIGGNSNTFLRLFLNYKHTIIIHLLDIYRVDFFVIKMHLNDNACENCYMDMDVEFGNQTNGHEKELCFSKTFLNVKDRWIDSFTFKCYFSPSVGYTLRLTFDGNFGSINISEFQAFTVQPALPVIKHSIDPVISSANESQSNSNKAVSLCEPLVLGTFTAIIVFSIVVISVLISINLRNYRGNPWKRPTGSDLPTVQTRENIHIQNLYQEIIELVCYNKINSI